jgi:hypothetical protein
MTVSRVNGEVCKRDEERGSRVPVSGLHAVELR